MSDRRPAFRLTIKHDGQRYDFGTVWPSERFDGLYDVQFQVGDVSGQYPKMDAAKAIKLATERDATGRKVAFVSLASAKPKGNESRSGGFGSARGNDDFGGGGSDPDVPFAPFQKRRY